MVEKVLPPAYATILGLPGSFWGVVIPVVGICFFLYIIARRLIPISKGAPDPRFDNLGLRFKNLIKYWLFQYKQPRYMVAGVIHIVIFVGFLVLSIRSISLVIEGFYPGFVFPFLGGALGKVYSVLKSYFATFVFIACIVAAVRRVVFKPERYKVPPKYGKEHTAEAVLVLGLIGSLMVFESLFEASSGSAHEIIPPLTLVWFFKKALLTASVPFLQGTHSASYFLHDIIFFFFLCFLPFGKHFHVITSIFNVFFMRLERGTIKPVKWGVSEEELDDLEHFGVKYFEDFTWKHMLDFYTCVDCGRCSDNCPANYVGRPLSPRFITIKSRDYMFDRYPIFGKVKLKEPVVGKVFEEHEIWSCTTCGACEEECPVCNEYINKIVDLRRGLVDEGNVPQTIQKALSALEKRGNPYGKLESKRLEWVKSLEGIEVKEVSKKFKPEVLYFVDSATSYDERLQEIAKATVTILAKVGVNFGVLGKKEKDSGHEVRRFGEEFLFMTLRDMNTDAIVDSGADLIVTSDPHAFNCLKKDYSEIPPVEHITQFILRNIKENKIRLRAIEDDNLVFTYHDPCYLGRHNLLYDVPREVLDSIPNLKRVEMERCKDRSFCCGGGGLMLFYEPIEDKRMGQVRAEMAYEAGANVIITACPFCLVNIEDGIKTSGLEGKVKVMDITELILQQLM